MSLCRRPGGLAGLLLILLLVAPQTALAAAEYVKSAPAPEALVGADISGVTLVFSQRVDPHESTVSVLGPDGRRVDQGPVVLDLSGRSLRVSLAPGLRPGLYTVRWTTVSADDGQRRAGSFRFGVTPLVEAVGYIAGREVSLQRENWVKGRPERVALVFSEALGPESTVVVTDDAGRRVDRGDGGLDPADPQRRTLQVSLLPGQGGGKFFVRWTAKLAAGGESLTGTVGFVALPWQPSAAPAPVVTTLPRTGGAPGLVPGALGLLLLGTGWALRRRPTLPPGGTAGSGW